MKAIYFQAAGAIALTFGLGTLAACVPASTPPAPTPPPVVAPAPTPPPPPPPPPPVVQEPVFANYLDAPQSPGTWTYLAETNETLALFGTDPQNPDFIVRCGDGSVGLGRRVSSPANPERLMTVKTETTTRQLQTQRILGRSDLVAVPIDVTDPLLDAMAITKGRIAIGVEGERTLYVPAWVEITRVIEDCR